MMMPMGASAQVAMPPAITITPKGPVISLSVQDSIQQAPDIASILVEITVRNRDRGSTIADGNALMAKLKAALTGKGVASPDVTQAYFGAREDYENNGGVRRVKGFVLQSGLLVKLHRLDRLGEVIGAAVTSGATRVSELHFDVENKGPIAERLLASATAKGRSRAMEHARINGFANARLLSVTEAGQNAIAFAPPAPRYSPIDGLDIPVDLTPRPVTISVSLAMAFELTN